MRAWTILDLPPYQSRPWTLERLKADPSCLDPEGCMRIAEQMDAALEELGRRCIGVMLEGQDYVQRTRYAVETDPGDIGWHEWGFARDRGGAEAWEDWE